MDLLASYITTAGLASREAEIRTLIVQGAHDVHAIMTSPCAVDELRRSATSHTKPNMRSRQVTGIMWYLTALAVERNQGFVRGAFVCRDPHGRLSAYFLGIGRPRISSHLKRQTAPGCTGGVDLEASDTLPPLAYGLQHVLFIVIARDKRRGNCLFLKPEMHSVVGAFNFVRHAVFYVRSVARKRRFGANESAGMRKERIPDRLVQEFSNAVAGLPDGARAIAEAGRRGDGDGIGCMHHYLVTKLADASLHDSAREPLAALLTRMESEYDFVALRFGNEVFVDLAAQLARPLPQAPGVIGPSPHLWWLRPGQSEESSEQEKAPKVPNE